jgi:tetratricopeptide (TPR) repeat protein
MKTSNIGIVLEGIEEAKSGNTTLGLRILTNAGHSSQLPEAKAWYGYCIAREKNDFARAISLCKEARQIEPENSDIYYALGRIYLLAGLRGTAIKVLKYGLAFENNQEIYVLLKCIGTRKTPVIRFLNRNSRINIVLGSLLTKMNLR